MGSRPRFVPFVVAVVAVAACSQSSNNQTTAPVDLGMTSTMAAYYSDEELTLYEAQVPVPLPVRAPTASDLSALGPTPAGTPYPHAPYLNVNDESLEVHYTISNIDSQDHTVWMLIDPWNEFVRWNPGVSVVSDEETVPNYGYDIPFLVPALSRVDGTITTDDMHEIAIKLASVENLLASPQAMAADSADAGDDGSAAPDDPNASSMAQNDFDATGIANNIMNPQNRSNGDDPIYTPWIPPVIAGLTGFDLGLRTYETANVAIEITIDIQDLNGNRFVSSGSTQAQIGLPPVTLSPAAARF
ncbi:MAG TPA: hypothetical protein VGL81_05275 [Polyangiaceae bacterium]